MSDDDELHDQHCCRCNEVEEGISWQAVVLGIAFLLFLSFICTDGWGLFPGSWS